MKRSKAEIVSQLYYLLFLFLAFSIPIYDRLVVIIILAISLLWLIDSPFIRNYRKFKQDRNRLNTLLFASLYVIYGFGLIYTSNLAFGLFDMQVKMSLLVFPVIISTMDRSVWTGARIQRILISYLAGSVFVTLTALFISLHNYLVSNSSLAFYYTNLSAFHHPSYFAMNLNLAIAILIVLMIKNRQKIGGVQRIIYFVLLLYFFVFVIMLSSKAGMICVLLVFVFSISAIIFDQKEYVVGLLFMILLPFTFIGVYYAFPDSLNRLILAKEIVSGDYPVNQASTVESNNERLLVWRSSLELIGPNFWMGVGTGDVKDVLMNKYKEKGIAGAFERKLNAHNQYLQTFVALGVAGLLVLLCNLFFPLWGAYRHRDLLYILFILIIGFNFIVESMLERQAGVVFYSFFNAFLYFTRKTEFSSDQIE